MRVIVRPPGSTFAEGITSAGMGRPNLALALDQHRAYVEALRGWNIPVIELPPDDEHPDSTFVEDCAVVAGDSIIWTRPGAASRRGEVRRLQSEMPFALPSFEIEEPYTVDGGDICLMDNRFVIGVSDRTSRRGSLQFQKIVNSMGFDSILIDVRDNPTLLHLKTGLSFLGRNTIVCQAQLAGCFTDPIVVADEESYAGNCASFGDGLVLIPEGAPTLRRELVDRGFEVREIPMSEFQKMDGGISCLSLRFPSDVS